MKRWWILAAAVVAGAAAALLVTVYLSSASARIAKEGDLVQVLVATRSIARGEKVSDLLAGKALQVRSMPRRYVAQDAVQSDKDLGDKVLAVALGPAGQLTESSLVAAEDAGLAQVVPAGSVALAVPFEDARGVAALVKPGDDVTLLGSVQLNASDQSSWNTKVLLAKTKVLAVGESLSAGQQGAKPKQAGGLGAEGDTAVDIKSITLAVPVGMVEKVVFAAERGKVWLGLYGTGSKDTAKPAGQSSATVLR